MSDYYAHRGPGKTPHDERYYDYADGTDTAWIWLAILLFAAASLIAVVVSGDTVPDASVAQETSAPLPIE